MSASVNYMSPSGNLKGFAHSDREQYLQSSTPSSWRHSSPRKYSALDPWVNVEIPLIEAYEASEKTDDDDRYTIASNRIRPYLETSSLVGIPMSGIANFSINFRMKVK